MSNQRRSREAQSTHQPHHLSRLHQAAEAGWEVGGASHYIIVPPWLRPSERVSTQRPYACRFCRTGLMYMTTPHLCEAMVVASEHDSRLAQRVDWCRRTLRHALKKVFDRYEILDEVLGI